MLFSAVKADAIVIGGFLSLHAEDFVKAINFKVCFALRGFLISNNHQAPLADSLLLSAKITNLKYSLHMFLAFKF